MINISISKLTDRRRPKWVICYLCMLDEKEAQVSPQ